MDYVSLIKEPISHELADFIGLFNSSLTHDDGMLGCALEHVKQRAGKRMRPILILLMAKNFGAVSQVTLHSAVGLELLHTASLIHDVLWTKQRNVVDKPAPTHCLTTV